MSFCALCTADILGAPYREPLGRNDALVDVCASCATEPAREGHGIERSYEGAGPAMSPVDVERGARRVLGDERYERDNRDLQRPLVIPAKPEADVMAQQHRYENIRRARAGSYVNTKRRRAQERYAEQRRIGRAK